MTIIRNIFLFAIVLLLILPAGCAKRHKRAGADRGERSGRIRLLMETRDIDVYGGSCDRFSERTVSLSSVLPSLAADKSLAYDKVTVCGGYHVYYVRGHGIDGWVKGSKTAETIATVKSAVPRSQWIEVASDLTVVRGSTSDSVLVSPIPDPVLDEEPAPETMTETEPAPEIESTSERAIEIEPGTSGPVPLEEPLEQPIEQPLEPQLEALEPEPAAPAAPTHEMPSEEVEIMTERDYEKELERELQRERQKEQELQNKVYN